MMAWHVNMTWHNIGGLILCLTVPGHYWITLTIHAFKLALGKGITAPLVAVPARRVLHGLYAIWWLAPALSRALGALSHGARGTPGLHCASRRGACRLSMDSRKRQRALPGKSLHCASRLWRFNDSQPASHSSPPSCCLRREMAKSRPTFGNIT